MTRGFMGYIKNFSFKNFFLREDANFFKEQIAEIMQTLQNMLDGMKSMGAEEFVEDAKTVTSKIRGIIQGSWVGQKENIEKLQRIGVYLCKALDENDDLEMAVRSSLESIKNEIIKTLAGPVNQLGVDSEEQQAEEPVEEPVSEPEVQGKPSAVSGFSNAGAPPLGMPPNQSI